ncbi:hypothetical protein A3860_34375 [Niastella vici]|uniref:DUF2933 domain-containing protein n=1 Tax=Niastella vici TaxID=1703345 RepID=A0A1V9FP84_9BACT|nr:hypothetical protein A3860_34375 [Niastella vici]
MMLIGCGLPLLLIILAPVFGIKGNWSTLIFVVAMFACHLLMPMHQHSSKPSNKTNHESHSH